MLTDANNSSTPINGDDFQELLTLVRTLRLANGITILFAQCSDTNYRNRLIEQTRQLYGDRIAVVHIPQGTNHLLDYLVEVVPDHAAAIFILGIEDWLPSGTVGETSRFVATLNGTRDHFPKLIHRPIVFWAPSHILTTLFRGAPDFFSTISGIYSFSSGEEKRLPQAHAPTSDREAEQRETELVTLLAEHDSLPEDRQDEATRAVLLLGIGKARREAGRYAEAEQPLKEALKITEHKFGLEHTDTATAANELGILYLLEHRLEKAEQLFRQGLRIRERALGFEHPDTGTSLNNLAELYESHGRYTEAEPLYMRALAIREKALGFEHPDTGTSLNNLAVLYESQGRYAEAESLYVRALAISEKALGDEHPLTAGSLNNLAELYRSQGRYAEAEPLYVRALKIWRQVLGDSHPNTRIGVGNLNELYRLQQRYKDILP